MVYPLKTRLGVTLPDFGAQLDLGHPLANGMTSCWLSNGGTKLPYNLITGVRSTLDTSGRVLSVGGLHPDGVCIVPNVNVLYDTGMASFAYNQGTVVMKQGYDQTWNTSGNVPFRGFFGMIDQTPTPNPMFAYYAQGDGTLNWIYAGWLTGGVDYRIKCQPIVGKFTSSVDHQIVVLTWDSNVGTYLYNRICPAYANIGNGLRDSNYQGQLLTMGSNTTPPVPAVISGGGFGFMGVKWSTGASTSGNGYYRPWTFTYLYNRVLTYDEIDWITTSPYCMFQQPKHLWTRTPDIVRAGIILGV